MRLYLMYRRVVFAVAGPPNRPSDKSGIRRCFFLFVLPYFVAVACVPLRCFCVIWAARYLCTKSPRYVSCFSSVSIVAPAYHSIVLLEGGADATCCHSRPLLGWTLTPTLDLCFCRPPLFAKHRASTALSATSPVWKRRAWTALTCSPWPPAGTWVVSASGRRCGIACLMVHGPCDIRLCLLAENAFLELSQL